MLVNFAYVGKKEINKITKEFVSFLIKSYTKNHTLQNHSKKVLFLHNEKEEEFDLIQSNDFENLEKYRI
jgi:hypothetical protein